MIEEIHIVHHSHTDFGYTDLPSTIKEQQVRYIAEAVEIARKTEKYPEASKFRWTCEVLLPVADFFAQATKAERRGFDRAFANGQIELGAMPAVMSGLLWPEELEAALSSLRPLFKKYKPRVLFQNDVNGKAWGILPQMRKAGVRHVWMGMNSYSGFSPRQLPALWWWEGPDGVRMLTMLATHYNRGYALFFPNEWRRGPVPAVSDVWYHPPQGRDTWDDSSASLAAAHVHCQNDLAENFPDWPFPELAVQVTNEWRFDNDPPSAQLPRFVRAWNAAGLLPRLRLSTPATFMAMMQRRHGKAIPTARGDWQDWWDDGEASFPAELHVSQQAKRLLVDLDGGQRALRSRASIAIKKAEGWNQALLFSEHTYHPFNSIAEPYTTQASGHRAQSFGNAYLALEHATLARAELIRKAPAYLRSAQSRHLAVLNPGSQDRSGWAEFKGTALRFPANAARDLKTGEIFPFEDQLAPQWSEADPALPRPFEIPDDIWNFGVETRRVFVPAVAPGEIRRLELIEAEPAAPPVASVEGENRHFSWKWDSRSGRLLSLCPPGEASLIDDGAEYGMAEPVVQEPQGFGVRSKLLNRSACKMRQAVPMLTGFHAEGSHYSARFAREWEHSDFHAIRQTWDFFHGVPILEIETTFWFKETTDPRAILLAFPFLLSGAKAVYSSMGWPTEVGRDQLPGSCGEHAVVGPGVEFSKGQKNIFLSTPANPLGCFADIQLRTGARATTPKNAHFYSLISDNYWMTNFSITKAAKVTTRHRISTALPVSGLTCDLWSFPCSLGGNRG